MDDYISREAVKEAAWEGFINRLVEDQGMYPTPAKCWLDWLRQEAKE